MEELKAFFRPEFLNRIDDIVVFKALTKDDLRGIVDIQLRRLERLLATARSRCSSPTPPRRASSISGTSPRSAPARSSARSCGAPEPTRRDHPPGRVRGRKGRRGGRKRRQIRLLLKLVRGRV
jgi:hypothetical protein